MLLASLALGASAGAQTVLTETQKLSPDFGDCQGPWGYCPDRQLGISVAVSENTILAAVTLAVTTPDEEAMFDVLAFTRGSDGRWQPEQQLFANWGYYGSALIDPSSTDAIEIDLDGPRALVGNPFWSDLSIGVVYSFRQSTTGVWAHDGSMGHPYHGYSPAPFGFDIAIAGDVSMIDGHLYRDTPDGWRFVQSLAGPDWFFFEPVVHNDYDGRTVVTARSSIPYAPPAPVVIEVWEADATGVWSVVQTIEPPDGTAAAIFGQAVAIDGDILLVGAPEVDDSAGAVFEYFRGSDGQWRHAATLTAADPLAGSRFGEKIEIDDHTVMVLAPAANGAVPNGGAAYWFEKQADGGWLERGKLVPSDGYDSDRFGEGFDLDGRIATIGAPGPIPTLFHCDWHPQCPPWFPGDAGAVYVYDLADLADEFVPIAIDVRPGAPINAVNPNYGMIPVAILTTRAAAGDDRDFDALQVDPATATLGPAEANVRISSRTVRAVDVDKDGDVDLTLSFRARDTGIECGATTISLEARTFAGDRVAGQDTIKTMFCN